MPSPVCLCSVTHGTFPIVLHSPSGPNKTFHRAFKEVHRAILKMQARPAVVLDDLTVLTWNSAETKLLVEQCFAHMGIPYTVLRPAAGVVWENWLKIQLTYTFLQSVSTTYVMGVDASDVLMLESPNEVVRRFRLLVSSSMPRCRLLFGAERNDYPKGDDLKYATKREHALASAANELPFCHLNTGTFIGTTLAALHWFEVASDSPRSVRCPDSDQGVWRQFYLESNGAIAIDRRCEIFQVIAVRYDPGDTVSVVYPSGMPK